MWVGYFKGVQRPQREIERLARSLRSLQRAASCSGRVHSECSEREGGGGEWQLGEKGCGRCRGQKGNQGRIQRRSCLKAPLVVL